MFEIVETHSLVQLSFLFYSIGANVSIISVEVHDALLRYGEMYSRRFVRMSR